jgi:hypothetical protein
MEGKADFQGAFYKNRELDETGFFVKFKNGTIRELLSKEKPK